jgi:hypothetical protein
MNVHSIQIDRHFERAAEAFEKHKSHSGALGGVSAAAVSE